MKKIKYLVLIFISLFAFDLKVSAASGSLSVSSLEVYPNDSFSVSVNVSSAAAWSFSVSASGPVSGCSTTQADATSDAKDTNKSFSVSCTATGEGTISISLSGDVTSAIDGVPIEISDSTTVSVVSRPEPTPKPTPTPDSSSNQSNNNQTNNNNNSNSQSDTKSNNNNVKRISVPGYELKKEDNNNYSLVVPSSVSSISIDATLEDSKAKVTGTGRHNLKVGENTIEVIVTAENGKQNKIYIKVNRKSENSLEDLDSILNDLNADNSFNIENDTVIDSDDMDKIIKSNEKVKLNYYDKDNNLVYSWILDGTKIDNNSDFKTSISFVSNNKSDIQKLSNYAEGINVVINSDDIPKGTKLKLYVGDNFQDEDSVNIYSYKQKKLLFKDKKVVKNGYIEIDDNKEKELFITMSNIKESSNNENNNRSKFLILIGLISILIIINIIVIIVSFKNKKKKKLFENNNVYNSIQ